MAEDPTVVTLVAEAARHPRWFWLDGAATPERRSVVGWLADDDPSLTYDAAAGLVTRHRSGRSEVVGTDVLAVLGEELAAGSPDDLWVGYLGYAARPDLPARSAGPAAGHGDVPDAVWLRAGRFEVVTHADRIEAAAGPPHDHGPLTDEAAYRAGFARVQERLRAGDSYEVNLTFRVERTAAVDPLVVYRALRARNPAPYAGLLQHDVAGARAWLLSSSPERFLRVDADRRIETRPIKGTTPRGATPAEDRRLRERLATDERFRAENLMIVDLLRNDLAVVCAPGTVEVPRLMEVESYPSVHQLVSTVAGRLAEAVSTVEAVRALFPAGSMTGAPKLRTMQVIEEVETSPRGAYAGAFGWLSGDGRADLGVVIRSLTSAGDGRWRLGVGGGITVDSDPATELAEASWKAAALLDALAEAAGGSDS